MAAGLLIVAIINLFICPEDAIDIDRCPIPHERATAVRHLQLGRICLAAALTIQCTSASREREILTYS
jgi:hypothetical protein